MYILIIWRHTSMTQFKHIDGANCVLSATNNDAMMLKGATSTISTADSPRCVEEMEHSGRHLPSPAWTVQCLLSARGHAKSLGVRMLVTWQTRFSSSDDTKWKSKKLSPVFVSRNDLVTTARWCIVGSVLSYVFPFLSCGGTVVLICVDFNDVTGATCGLFYQGS